MARLLRAPGSLGQKQDVPVINDVPLIPFESVPNFFKITPDMNFGETPEGRGELERQHRCAESSGHRDFKALRRQWKRHNYMFDATVLD